MVEKNAQNVSGRYYMSKYRIGPDYFEREKGAVLFPGVNNFVLNGGHPVEQFNLCFPSPETKTPSFTFY